MTEPTGSQRDRRLRLEILRKSLPIEGALAGAYLELKEELARAELDVKRVQEHLDDVKYQLSRLSGRFTRLHESGVAVVEGIRFVETGDSSGLDLLTQVSDSLDKTTTGLAHVRIDPLLAPRQVTGKKTFIRADVQDLFAAGYLRPGDRLVAVHKRRRHEAVLRPDGSIDLDDGRNAQTLSAAGRLITRSEINGWRFWGIERQSGWIPLANVRDEFLVGESRDARRINPASIHEASSTTDESN